MEHFFASAAFSVHRISTKLDEVPVVCEQYYIKRNVTQTLESQARTDYL